MWFNTLQNSLCKNIATEKTKQKMLILHIINITTLYKNDFAAAWTGVSGQTFLNRIGEVEIGLVL
jgi:hypothetical protein